MKMFLTICCLLGVLLANSQVREFGNLQVKGTQLSDQAGNPVSLRGVSLGWHQWWPRFYKEETVDWLANDWKCSVIRAAVGVEPANGYLQNPSFAKAKVKAVVEQAIQNDIYVIIDWHSHNIKTKDAVAFFTEMAALYGKYPNVIYEIFNEPEKASWPEIKSYAETVVAAIRKIDDDNIILVGTPKWDQDVHIAAKSPLKGYKNLMYTLHFYAATHKQWLRNRCEYALKKGVPIFISECAGMEATGDGPVNHKEWKNWIKYAEENKLSWIAWSISDKNETCSMLYPTASTEGGWQTKDIKPWGLEVRELIRRLNYHEVIQH